MQVVGSSFVNIFDLVERHSVQSFPSLDELRVYTIETDNFFPRENAYAGGVLTYLLREILGPYKGRRQAGRMNGRGRGGGRAQGRGRGRGVNRGGAAS